MRSRNLKIVLKEDAKEIFNPMEEKNKFLKRLYKENITPPKKTLCKSLFPVFQKDNIDNIVNYGLLIALLIVSGGEIKIEYDTSSIKLNSPVMTSFYISGNNQNDDNPFFEISFKTNGKVENIIAANEDAKIAIGQTHKKGELDLDEAIKFIFDSSKNSYYLNVNATKDNPNKINVLFYGNDSDVIIVKKRVGKTLANYLKKNYIYAQFYDCKKISDNDLFEQYRIEAKKFEISLEKYVAILNINTYLSCFSDEIKIEELIEKYRNCSYEKILAIKNTIVESFLKIKYGKQITSFKNDFEKLVKKYKDIRSHNFNEWRPLFLKFMTSYTNVIENKIEEVGNIDCSNIYYSDFDAYNFAILLSKFMSNKDFQNKEKVNLKYEKDDTYLIYQYKNLYNNISVYYQEEKDIIEEICHLIETYSSQIDEVLKENQEQYVLSQLDRQKIDDERNVDFYDDFKKNEDTYFIWY